MILFFCFFTQWRHSMPRLTNTVVAVRGRADGGTDYCWRAERQHATNKEKNKALTATKWIRFWSWKCLELIHFFRSQRRRRICRGGWKVSLTARKISGGVEWMKAPLFLFCQPAMSQNCDQFKARKPENLPFVRRHTSLRSLNWFFSRRSRKTWLFLRPNWHQKGVI